ncbi:MAG: hypothetical protein EHJ94_08430 [Deltaproteobacteria bacterium]|nr:MAG: hypothetical protein EHJ94_08430 [Deltaproteobacteria bacterium]
MQIILPFIRKEEAIAYARESGLFLNHCVHVFPVPGKPAKRILLSFSFNYSSVEEGTIIIEMSGRHGYSSEYQKLLKDFYLFL